MCEANAYLADEGQEYLIMEAVDVIEPDGEDSWYLVGIFGDRRTVKGRMKAMNLADHKILFEGKTCLNGFP